MLHEETGKFIDNNIDIEMIASQRVDCTLFVFQDSVFFVFFLAQNEWFWSIELVYFL